MHKKNRITNTLQSIFSTCWDLVSRHVLKNLAQIHSYKLGRAEGVRKEGRERGRKYQILPLVTTVTGLEGIMLIEIDQREKDNTWFHSYVEYKTNNVTNKLKQTSKKLVDTDNTMVVTAETGGGGGRSGEQAHGKRRRLVFDGGRKTEHTDINYSVVHLRFMLLTNATSIKK